MFGFLSRRITGTRRLRRVRSPVVGGYGGVPTSSMGYSAVKSRMPYSRAMEGNSCGGGIEVPIGDWEARGWRVLICLLFSTRHFDLYESPDSMRLPNDPK